MQDFIICFVSALLTIAVGYYCFWHQKYRNFKRFVKCGDIVEFYVGEEKRVGRILEINDDEILLSSFGELFIRGIDNVYRCLI